MYCPHCGNFNEDTAVSCSTCGNSLRGGISSTLSGDFPYVGFWPRLAAAIVDAVILNIVTYIVTTAVMMAFGDAVFTGIAISYGLSLGIGILYFAGLESSEKQATFGKQALGIKVVDIEGNRISFGKAILRYITKIITGLMLGLGYFAIIFSEKKQGLYDMIAQTYVVYNK